MAAQQPQLDNVQPNGKTAPDRVKWAFFFNAEHELKLTVDTEARSFAVAPGRSRVPR
jgi:hypothetical protein